MSKDNKTKSIPAASLKLLAGAAPAFDMPVKISRADGSVFELTVQVKGMRKSEWAARGGPARLNNRTLLLSEIFGVMQLAFVQTAMLQSTLHQG